MRIEKQYAFNAENYIRNADGIEVDKDEFNIIYKYFNKIGENVSINIVVKLLERDKEQQILRKGDLNIADGKSFFAQIVFDNPVELSEFVIPEWLDELKPVN